MSTEQENFDDLLKSKLDESTFAFNEANWDKAEMLIIQAEKKRKRRIIGFIFFIGMLLGVCVMIPFISSKNDIEKRDLTVKNKNITSGSKTEIAIKSDNKPENSNKIAKVNADTKSVKENEQTASSSNNVVYENRGKEVNLKKEKAIIVGSYPSEKQRNNSPDAIFTENEKNVVNKDKEQKGRSEGEKNNANPSIIKEKEKPVVIAANNNGKKDKGKTIKTEEIKNTISVKDSQSNNAVVQVSDSTRVSALTTSTTLKRDTSMVTKNTIGTVKDNVVKTKVSALTDASLKRDTSIIAKTTTGTAKDSVVKTTTDSVKPVVDSKPEIFKKITILSVDAGVNYAFGWANNSIKEAVGLNAIFGVSVTHKFTKKWAVLVGVQYNSLAHLNYSNYTTNNLRYDFGYNQTKTIITPTILYYTTVPIKLQYHFNDKNSLSIGLNALYLLNTSSKVETYTESTFGTPVYNSSTKMGYMDGFATWDLQPALAYRRRIFKGLCVNIEAYYGLMDIKKNSVFGSVKTEHNSGLKLTLSYNLIHK
jgi:hypothetical protein